MTRKLTSGGSTLGISEYLEERAVDRAKTNRPIILPELLDVRESTERIICGTFSQTFTRSHIRYLRRSTLVSCGHGLQTPGDVVRDYLDFYHPKRLRACASQAKVITEHVTTPLAIRPGVYPDCTYVDIQSAYWSILRLVGWDVDYFPGQWFVPGRLPDDFPLPHEKPARAMLVSLGLPSSTLIWTGSAFRRQATRNLHLNMGLWRLVQDILHSIAAAAVALGAVYVHTDGYMVPSQHADTLREEIATWGLPSSIKGSGFTMVLGFSNFACGDRHSKTLKPILSQPYHYIRRTPAIWLKPQIQRLAFVNS